MTRTFLKQLGVRRGRTILLVLLAVACIGWGIYSLVELLRTNDSATLRVAGGAQSTRRFAIAQYLAAQVHDAGLGMEIVPTKGFEDSMRRVVEGAVDAALVSSCLEAAEYENVRLVAGLDVAPLHILMRRELALQKLSLVEAVRGRRVSFGVPGTNDYEVATDVFQFLRLHGGAEVEGAEDEVDFVHVPLAKDELRALAAEAQAATGAARKAALAKLPDVMLMIASLPSPVVQALIDTQEYQLAPFPYADHYRMSMLEGSRTVAAGAVHRSYVEAATIPASMYVGDVPLPTTDCRTIGLRTLLVARTDLPTPQIMKLLEVMFETDFARQIQPLSARNVATSYEIHPGAVAYLDRNEPLFTGQFFERISGALSIFGAFSAGALSLYSYLRRRKIRQPDEYIAQIRRVESMLTQTAGDMAIGASREVLVRDLESQLLRLKEELIHDYCNHRIEGEMVVLSILSMLADSRAELRRTTRAARDSDPTHASLNGLEVGALRVA